MAVRQASGPGAPQAQKKDALDVTHHLYPAGREPEGDRGNESCPGCWKGYIGGFSPMGAKARFDALQIFLSFAVGEALG